MAKEASAEVLQNHKGLKGKDLNDYMGQYFARTWNHFDVNKTGLIEVLDTPAFMRYLASDQQLNLE